MKKKMVVVCQRDIKDCGPCCLLSIIRYFDGNVSLEKIRLDAYTSINGTSVYHLVKAAEKYGFDALAKKLLDSRINNIMLPAIIHMHLDNGLDHFMCLYEAKKDSVILMDPAKGKVKMPYEMFNHLFTGVFIELHPRSKIIYMNNENSIYDLFVNIIKDNKKLCLSIVLCSFILTILTIICGSYFKVVIEMINHSSYESAIKYIVYLFLGLTILKIVFKYYRSYYENHLNKNIDTNIFKDFINHIFDLPLKVTSARSSGEVITRVNELDNIKELFAQIIFTFLLDFILAFAALLVLFWIDKRLSFILCLSALIYLLLSFLYNPYLYKRMRKNIELQTEFNSSLIDNISMINSLKNLNKIDLAKDKNEKSLSKLIYDNYTFTSNINIFNMIRDGIYDIGIFIVNSYAFYLISKGNLTFINLVFFNSIYLYFMEPIKNMMIFFTKFGFMRASFQKISEFTAVKKEDMGNNGFFINDDIKFENVNYSYSGYYKNINNLNLIIHKGEKIIINGKSGCGKSTMCKLLNKTYTPESGNILIGDKNILDYSTNTIRNNITYVGQKEGLYTDTIKNNILLGRKEDKYFRRVCQICLIDDIASRKAFRYDFGINSDASNISGGERQRIILARSLLNNSSIYILDEALSELDIMLERKIINNMKNYYPNKTIIYVSHKNQSDLFDRTIDFERINNYE